jgi:hypothetical protein
MMRPMPKNEGGTEPCQRCGKAPRADALGYCRDCADTLALRGLLVLQYGLVADEAHAETDPDRTPENKAP